MWKLIHSETNRKEYKRQIPRIALCLAMTVVAKTSNNRRPASWDGGGDPCGKERVLGWRSPSDPPRDWRPRGAAPFRVLEERGPGFPSFAKKIFGSPLMHSVIFWLKVSIVCSFDKASSQSFGNIYATATSFASKELTPWIFPTSTGSFKRATNGPMTLSFGTPAEFIK